MGCYENPGGLARALTFVFNNAWEGGGAMSGIGVISFMLYS